MLRLYEDATDDILIGEATAEPGSYHDTFCRQRMKDGDVLGKYTSRRQKDG
jgi:hypothetical protein